MQQFLPLESPHTHHLENYESISLLKFVSLLLEYVQWALSIPPHCEKAVLTVVIRKLFKHSYLLIAE